MIEQRQHRAKIANSVSSDDGDLDTDFGTKGRDKKKARGLKRPGSRKNTPVRPKAALEVQPVVEQSNPDVLKRTEAALKARPVVENADVMDLNEGYGTADDAEHPPPAHREQAANPYADLQFGRRYEVILRTEDGTEYVYEIKGNALEASSPFFKAARADCWKKSNPSTILGDDEEPELFQRYMSIVIDGLEVWKVNFDAAIALSKQHPTDGTPVPPHIESMREKLFDDFVGVYLLAEKFMDHTTANIVIDEMVRLSKETDLVPHPGAVNQAYDSTPEGSPLRMLLRDWFIHEALPNTVENMVKGDVNPDFLVDLAVENSKLKTDNKQGIIKKWYYQQAASRPAGHYHLPNPEPPVRSTREYPTGSYQLLRIIRPNGEIVTPAQDGGEDDEESSSGSEA